MAKALPTIAAVTGPPAVLAATIGALTALIAPNCAIAIPVPVPPTAAPLTPPISPPT